MDRFEYFHADAESVKQMVTKIMETTINTPPIPKDKIERVVDVDIEVNIKDGKIIDYKILNEAEVCKFPFQNNEEVKDIIEKR